MEELVKHINDIKEKIDFVEYDNLMDTAGAVIGDREYFKSICSELIAENKVLKERLEKAVELPCKIGDYVYVVNEQERQIYRASITSILVFKTDGHAPNNSFKANVSYTQSRGEHDIYYINGKSGKEMGYHEKTFLTKAEAEARLKELKGEKE